RFPLYLSIVLGFKTIRNGCSLVYNPGISTFTLASISSIKLSTSKETIRVFASSLILSTFADWNFSPALTFISLIVSLSVSLINKRYFLSLATIFVGFTIYLPAVAVSFLSAYNASFLLVSLLS